MAGCRGLSQDMAEDESEALIPRKRNGNVCFGICMGFFWNQHEKGWLNFSDLDL